MKSRLPIPFLVASCLGWISPASAAPVVTNLTASQRAGTLLVDIAYEVAAPGFPSVTVSLEISSDAGATSFTGDANFDLEELLLAGDYSLHVFRQADGGLAQTFDLTIDASVVAASRPDVAVGASAGALTGVGLYSPASQLAALTSNKLRAVTAYASVANRGKLPDVLTVRGGRGSAFFKVVWSGPTGGNITAAMNSGTYRTDLMAEGTAPV